VIKSAKMLLNTVTTGDSS